MLSAAMSSLVLCLLTGIFIFVVVEYKLSVNCVLLAFTGKGIQLEKEEGINNLEEYSIHPRLGPKFILGLH